MQITDASGQLQYIPFPVCNETGKPLELYFGIEKGMAFPQCPERQLIKDHTNADPCFLPQT